MPVVSESRTGRSLSLKVPARFAITTEHRAFWHAMAAGHASKPVMINIEIALGKTVVVAENKTLGMVGPSTGKRQRPLSCSGSQASDLGVSRLMHDDQRQWLVAMLQLNSRVKLDVVNSGTLTNM